MKKCSSDNKVCVYCGAEAVEDTFPPVCEECAKKQVTRKQAQKHTAETLAELQALDGSGYEDAEDKES